MDLSKPANPSKLGRKLRSFTKALRFPSAGVSPDDSVNKAKAREKSEKSEANRFDKSGSVGDDEELQNRMAVEAVLAKVFASLSSVKAGYAQLQVCQSPYDAEGVRSADDAVVCELKRLSELKQCYLKKQIDPCPRETWLVAEREEQKSLLRTYEIIGKKLESQLKVKESEIAELTEKLDECRQLEKRLSRTNEKLSVVDDIHISGLNPTHFITALKHAVKSIRSFVKLMTNEMEASGWDIAAAACAIEPNAVYTKRAHTCFGFESFVSREMFDNFQYPNFEIHCPSTKHHRQHFFDQFTEMKSLKPKAIFLQSSPFRKFCQQKYSRLIHPKMERSLFGNLNQRDAVSAAHGFPRTPFFAAFAEMARRVWLLHCLSFSFQHEPLIFQVQNRSRFSEVYMESVTDDAFLSTGTPRVSLTVVPGFRIHKTVVQAQVYLSAASRPEVRQKVRVGGAYDG